MSEQIKIICPCREDESCEFCKDGIVVEIESDSELGKFITKGEIIAISIDKDGLGEIHGA